MLVNFLHRIQSLIDSTTSIFPMTRNATDAFNELKTDLAKVLLQPIDENALFVVETVANDIALLDVLT